MLKELVCDRLTDIAGPEDQRVLEIPGTSSSHRARCRPRQNHAKDRGRPEDQQLRRRRMSDSREIADDGGSGRTHRDHVENGRELVRRGVIGALLVPVVEPVGLRHHDPERQEQHESRDLTQLTEGSDSVVCGHRPLGDEEGGHQADHVRSRKRPPQHPAPAMRLPGRYRRVRLESASPPPSEALSTVGA